MSRLGDMNHSTETTLFHRVTAVLEYLDRISYLPSSQSPNDREQHQATKNNDNIWRSVSHSRKTPAIGWRNCAVN